MLLTQNYLGSYCFDAILDVNHAHNRLWLLSYEVEFTTQSVFWLKLVLTPGVLITDFYF